jgi:hypothetical protein
MNLCFVRFGEIPENEKSGIYNSCQQSGMATKKLIILLKRLAGNEPRV